MAQEQKAYSQGTVYLEWMRDVPLLKAFSKREHALDARGTTKEKKEKEEKKRDKYLNVTGK